MTEPAVASSDARNISTSIVRDDNAYVINGRKWWITGVANESCEIFIVMGKTDTHAAPTKRWSHGVPVVVLVLVVVRPPAVTENTSSSRSSIEAYLSIWWGMPRLIRVTAFLAP
jgi:Acyl-CoA dehydrogenase, middle domain